MGAGRLKHRVGARNGDGRHRRRGRQPGLIQALLCDQPTKLVSVDEASMTGLPTPDAGRNQSIGDALPTHPLPSTTRWLRPSASRAATLAGSGSACFVQPPNGLLLEIISGTAAASRQWHAWPRAWSGERLIGAILRAWPQQIPDRSRCGRARLVEEVPVAVEGEGDGGVTEPAADGERTDAGLNEMRHVRMPQVVKPDAGQPAPLHEPAEDPRNRLRMERLPTLVNEDEPLPHRREAIE